MKLYYTKRFERSYRATPPTIQKTFEKQIVLLLTNMHHPSLRAKKYDETHDIWQARINRNWRFYFLINGDELYLVDMTTHPK